MQKLKEAEEAPIADDYADLSFSHLHGWLNRTPQFLMYVYKVKTCQRSICYFPKKPCPFLHVGELGRRDLLSHKYSCVPCLEFKNGFCPQGDDCGQAHGVLEERFHPMLFRTRYCWYMTTCKRQDCSYAHKEEDKRAPTVAPVVPSLRPLKANTSCALTINSAKNPITIYATHSMMQTLWQKQQQKPLIGYMPSSSPQFCSGTNIGDENQHVNFDRLNGENLSTCSTSTSTTTTPYCSSTTVPQSSQWAFNNNQPDFSWVYGLVEDDQPNLFEEN